jgi:flagellar basal body-associated protein FliL
MHQKGKKNKIIIIIIIIKIIIIIVTIIVKETIMAHKPKIQVLQKKDN